MIPVQPSSRLHALTDDVDKELTAARGQLDGALATLRTAGIKANGRLDVGSPTRCLLDGLREFPATEIALLHDGKRGWEDAKQFAERIRIELGMDIYEVASTPHVRRGGVRRSPKRALTGGGSKRLRRDP